MNKPKEILELEKIYNIKLKQLFDGNMFHSNSRNHYRLSEQGDIIGLNLYNNGIAKIEGLEKLTKLKDLYLFNNKITKIEGLEKLAQLTNLSLYGNQITKIEGLEKLAQLTKLSLTGNQITKIEGLEKLTQLKELYLFNNQITKIEGLEKLTQLKELYLFNNQITKIEGLEKLAQLTKLSLTGNQITKIGGLEKLKQLATLSLYDNQITEIEGLGNLTNLKNLYISNNPISENISNLLRLEGLEYLSIHSVKILEELRLEPDQNHLNIVRSYLLDLEGKKIEIKLPIKVLLLGNHASGKSTFLKYFLTISDPKAFDSPIVKDGSTYILQTYNYPQGGSGLPTAIIYDFGGQDYYHGIYKAFLSSSSINLIFWHEDTDRIEIAKDKADPQLWTQHFDRAYWLHQLEYYYRDFSGDYQVRLVQTHADKENFKRGFYNDHNPKLHISDEYSVALDAKALMKDKYRSSIQLLDHSLIDQIEALSVKEKMPEYFKDLLTKIIGHDDPKAKKLEEFINENSSETTLTEIKDVDRLKGILERLSLSGLVLYYPEEKLKNYVWLNPAATIKHIHDEVLKKEILLMNHGIIDKEKFEKLGDELIRNLLVHHKVIFFDKENKNYIVPGYLKLFDKEDPKNALMMFGYDDPDFVMKFDHFIPFGIMNQLICHYGNNPGVKQFWRDNLLFTTIDKKFKVFIKLDFEHLEIAVYISGKEEKEKLKRELFLEISHFIGGGSIRQSYINNLRTKDPILHSDKYGDIAYDLSPENVTDFAWENINKIDNMYLSLDNKYFVHHKTLQETTESKIPSYPVDNNRQLDKKNSREQSLYNFKNYTNNPNVSKMKKIFISYSRDDIQFKDDLIKHLSLLNHYHVIRPWDCSQMKSGEWDEQIQKELEEADYIVYMVSPYFMSSDYIMEKEVKKGIELVKQNPSKKLFCVLVRECMWRQWSALEELAKNYASTEDKLYSANLGKYQFLPYHQYKDGEGKINKEEIVALDEWGRYPYHSVHKAYYQIAHKIFDEIKSDHD